MSPVAFLLIAVVIGVVGSLLLVVLNQRPNRGDSAIRDFEREMQALAPRSSPTDPDRPIDPDRPSVAHPGIIIDSNRRPEPKGPDEGPPGRRTFPSPQVNSSADERAGAGVPDSTNPRRRSTPSSRPGSGSGES